MAEPGRRRLAQFGEFALDLQSGELRREAHDRSSPATRLQDQPFQILKLLVARPGEVVTRDELRQALWAGDTFVDFEHSLNAAIKRLRDALGDSADAPRYVETIPRRGYRLIAPVDGVRAFPAEESGTRARANRRALIAAGVLGVTAIGLVAYLAHVAITRTGNATAPGPPQRTLSRLTFGSRVQIQPTWSPEGRFIAYASDRADNFDIWVQPVAGGDPVQVTKHPAHDWQPDWSLKNDLIAFRSERHGGGIFLVPALGGEERRLTSFGYRPGWSPDGTRLLFAASGAPGLAVTWGNIPTKFFVVGLDGAPPREILPDLISQAAGRATLAWHPDGRVTVMAANLQTGLWRFWTVPIDGGPRVESEMSSAVLAAIKSAGLETWSEEQHLAWSPPGDAIYFVAVSNHVKNVWKVDVDPITLRWIGGPHRLTAGPGPESDLVLSRDGNKAAFTTGVPTLRLWSFPLDPVNGGSTGPGVPITSAEAGAYSADLSRDGRTLLYESERAGGQGHRHEVWHKSLDDGRERLLRTHRFSQPGPVGGPMARVSPDGRLFAYLQHGRSFRIVIHDIASGEEWSVTEPDSQKADLDAGFFGQPGWEAPWGWSADGQWIVASATKYTPRAWGLLLVPPQRAPGNNRELRIVTTSIAGPAGVAHYGIYQAGLSPDGRWISFLTVARDHSTRIVAVRASGGTWTGLTDGRSRDDKPRWSSDGRFIYFVSPRDGVLNVWAMPFDTESGRAGEPFKVTRFDDPRVMIFPYVGRMEMGVAARRLVLPVMEVAGSIWMLDNVDR